MKDFQTLPGNGEEYSFDRIEKIFDPRLSGKKLFVLGSSVALGSASGGRAVGEYFAARFGMELEKSAVSGTTMTGLKSPTYLERLDAALPSLSADLFICQLSTNDARLGSPVGVPGSGPDRDTVCGAVEYILQKTEPPGRPRFFFTGSRYGSPAYGKLVELLYEIRKHYGFGILDLWSDDAFNCIPDEKRSLWMKDGVHPTAAGYRDWWGPELERQLLKQL